MMNKEDYKTQNGLTTKSHNHPTDRCSIEYDMKTHPIPGASLIEDKKGRNVACFLMPTLARQIIVTGHKSNETETDKLPDKVRM